jgi:hypothetical protein
MPLAKRWLQRAELLMKLGLAVLRSHGSVLCGFELSTPGVLYGCENKGVAEKGICKVMKTNDKKSGDGVVVFGANLGEVPRELKRDFHVLV